MTKKHFVLIAETIRDDCPLSARQKVAAAFAIKLAAENERFDRLRFMEAALAAPRQ